VRAIIEMANEVELGGWREPERERKKKTSLLKVFVESARLDGIAGHVLETG